MSREDMIKKKREAWLKVKSQVSLPSNGGGENITSFIKPVITSPTRKRIKKSKGGKNK